MAGNPIQQLQDGLNTQDACHEPWTTGIVNLMQSETSLFFKRKDGSVQFLQVDSITDADIDALVDACDAAVPAPSPTDGLDQTYRTAWRLDEDSFAWNFNPDFGHFVSQLAQYLCPWAGIRKGIRIGPSSLDIYGTGGSAKTKKDTAHDKAFGSLVFVLPTGHTGGNLVFHHQTRDLDFDTTATTQAKRTTSITFAAFYNDVEHEVTEVKLGSLVTIKFNLFFDATRHPPILPPKRLDIPDNPFKTALRELLRDAAFIRGHKFLAFGLACVYSGRFDALEGPDHFLRYVCSDFGLDLQRAYLCSSCQYGECDFWVMCFDIPFGRSPSDLRRTGEFELELEHLMEDEHSYIVWQKGKSEKTADPDGHPWLCSYFDDVEVYRERTVDITWVTPLTNSMTGETICEDEEEEEEEGKPLAEIYSYKTFLTLDISMIACPLPAEPTKHGLYQTREFVEQ